MAARRAGRRDRPQRLRRGLALVVLCGLIGGSGIGRQATAGKVETWRHDGNSSLGKGRREQVVLSESGRVRLALKLEPIGTLNVNQVWDLARAKDGTLFAATGNSGQVFHRVGDTPWKLAIDLDDSQVFALSAMPDGAVYAGTGPSGLVVDVKDPKRAPEKLSAQVKYVWDLAAGRDGSLYAATGPEGLLYKRSPQGAWSVLFDAPQAHLLSLAISPEGDVYAGSDGTGLIYRIDAKGKPSVVFDAAPSEIRVLRFGPDGALYVGTAQDAGGSGTTGTSRGLSLSESHPRPIAAAKRDDQVVTASARGTTTEEQKTESGASRTTRSGPAPGGTATIKPVSPGDNAVYRIGVDGVAREIFRQKLLIFDLAWQGDRMYVATGPEGQIFEIRDLGREVVPIARLDSGQVLAMLANPGSDLLVGTGDPGSVARLSMSHAGQGTLTSEVLDAKFPCRLGRVTWRGETPSGTSIAVEVRSGNVAEADATWSDWTTQPERSTSARRFAQYRVKLATTNPAATPELQGVVLHYQTINLPPEMSKVEVPDLSASDGAARQAKLTFKWEVTDPNGDDMEHRVFLRRDDWPHWVALHDQALTEPTLAWDSFTAPSGNYRIRVETTDLPSNPVGESETRELESAAFIVDHDSPTVALEQKPTAIEAVVKDQHTRLVKAAYSVDGGEWTAVFPADRLFDSREEKLTIPLSRPGKSLATGTHLIRVRVNDAAGNVGAGDLVITVD